MDRTSLLDQATHVNWGKDPFLFPLRHLTFFSYWSLRAPGWKVTGMSSSPSSL